MGSYEEIDSIIEKWASRHQLTLLTHTSGCDQQFRCVYLGSGSECCQIWIDAPTGDGVGVHAADVESRDDEEMRKDWSSAIPQLATVLDEAVRHVQRWFARHKPLPFRQAFGLFLRNSSPHIPFHPDFARQAGIGEGAATACILTGFFAAVPLTLGLAWLLIPWLVDFFWPLFIAVMVVFFLLAQGTVTYVVYRAWHRRRHSK